ncbi:hypothetical protein C444_05996 [Haloarcula japonica DSM 6131]|uniref:Sulfatase n=1 Tax=Haloarcula japonica (strain ATCC 49778 / DSM 6131 / JCM 7785 / NBRC 101032 / NCIMB 13157 / TR-1) TaxID=1227453 RepID=M0LL62_HALJT|nr:hypothetical protein C444_05996 [Haloarcula japonica DSM 6131]
MVKLSEKDVNRKLVREAYAENVEQVAAAVDNLLPELTGKTVITADHGEMLGERFRYVPIRGYGHPFGVYNEYTTKVPWNVIETGERKDIIDEKPTQDINVDLDAVDDQLRNLGYVL